MAVVRRSGLRMRQSLVQCEWSVATGKLQERWSRRMGRRLNGSKQRRETMSAHSGQPASETKRRIG